MEKSTFVKRATQRAAEGGIAVRRTKGMGSGGRTNARKTVSVAIDGRARDSASVCLYAEVGFSANLGGTAVSLYRPEIRIFVFRVFISQKKSSENTRRKIPCKKKFLIKYI